MSYSWHRYVFRYSYPYPIIISKAFHHAVRKGMLCLDLDEDTKKKNHRWVDPTVIHGRLNLEEIQSNLYWYGIQNQIPRSIRTCQLQNALLHVYFMPIKRLVLPWPSLSFGCTYLHRRMNGWDKRALILRWTSYLYAFSSYLLQT